MLSVLPLLLSSPAKVVMIFGQSRCSSDSDLPQVVSVFSLFFFWSTTTPGIANWILFLIIWTLRRKSLKQYGFPQVSIGGSVPCPVLNGFGITARTNLISFLNAKGLLLTLWVSLFSHCLPHWLQWIVADIKCQKKYCKPQAEFSSPYYKRVNVYSICFFFKFNSRASPQ